MRVLVVGNFVLGSFFCTVPTHLRFSPETGAADVKAVAVQHAVYS